MSISSTNAPSFWDKYDAMDGPVAKHIKEEVLTPQPEIDSIWLAKDGRRVRIMKIINHVGRTGSGWRAKIFVLPPREYRQKRFTYAGPDAFASKFYTLESL